MQPLDIDGLFWITSKPEDKVAGRLKFDPLTGSDLYLIGKFKNFVPTGGYNEPVRLNAVAGGKAFTLENCQFTGFRVQDTGVGNISFTRHQYHTSLMFSGAHFDESSPLLFKGVLLHLRYLEPWIHNINSRPIGYEAKGKEVEFVTHIFEALDRQAVAKTDFGELALSFGQLQIWDRYLDSVIMHDCCFDLRFDVPTPFDSIIDYCWLLQNLVSLGCDLPSAITGLALDHPLQIQDSSSNTQIPVIPYVPLVGNYAPSSGNPPSPSDLMFSYTDIGQLDGVVKWLKVANRYRVVLSALSSYWLSATPYSGNRFFNVCTAAEALRRIQLEQQNFNLSRELRKLTDMAGGLFLDLVGDVDKWSNKVIRTRQNDVVHPGLHDELEPNELEVLADSMYFLVLLCLLAECGLQENVTSSIKSARRFHTLQQELRLAN